MTSRLTHKPISRPIRNGPSTGSVGNNGSSQPASQTRKARTPTSRTRSGDRLEEIDRPLIVPSGISTKKNSYVPVKDFCCRSICQYYREPIGPYDNKEHVFTWEEYKWSSNPRVQTAASRIKDELWCNPSDQRDAYETFELNLAKKKQKTGNHPGLAGAWQHTHRLKRGNERVEMCSQKPSDRWHPEFDGSVIYEKTGRMPHERVRIADEAFTKIGKSIIKETKINVSQQEQFAREQGHLQRENRQLRHENKEGGLDYDALMKEGAHHESSVMWGLPVSGSGGFASHGSGPPATHNTTHTHTVDVSCSSGGSGGGGSQGRDDGAAVQWPAGWRRRGGAGDWEVDGEVDPVVCGGDSQRGGQRGEGLGRGGGGRREADTGGSQTCGSREGAPARRAGRWDLASGGKARVQGRVKAPTGGMAPAGGGRVRWCGTVSEGRRG
ncbi:hypothetical protein ZWY2020_028809 [Hordeum vulgare]|nr:hypothetical protein ZWY2020_028809 [Hordeum vulgare]